MYIVFFLTSILLYLILRKFEDQDKMKKLYIIIMTLLLCFCTAFRNLAVGNDTYAYYLHFKSMDSVDLGSLINTLIDSIGIESNNSNKDRGYPIIVKLAYHICFGSFQCYQFLVGLIVLCPLGYLIYHLVSKFYGYIFSYGFYLTIFYHYLPNSATRQSIALGLFLCAAILWIRKHNLIWPVILLLIASTIHKSVLIGALPFGLMYINDKRRFITYTIWGTIAMFVMGATIALWLSNMVNSENYALYSSSTYYDKQATGKPMGYILQMISLFVLSLYNDTKINEDEIKYQFVRICFYLGIVFVPLILIDPSLIRLDAYFAIWGVIFIPNILDHFEYNSRHLQIAFIIVFILVLGRPLLSGTVKYRFEWEYMKLHERYSAVYNNFFDDPKGGCTLTNNQYNYTLCLSSKTKSC